MSPHFSVSELTRTNTGLPNVATPDALANLGRLVDTILEPARELLGCPIVIHSGYRCPAVNRRVGGVPNSYHVKGLAADFHPLAIPIKDAFNRLIESSIPYDKAILEHRYRAWWIHIQAAEDGKAPRRKAYTGSIDPIDGFMKYVEVERV